MNHRFHRPSVLSSALCLALAGPAFAQTHDQHRADELDRIQVKASPLREGAESQAQPVEILHGEELDKRKAGTLGETLAGLPGVQSASFGPGVGRPVIRGQEGPRVQVLSGGMASMDASTVSADHAIAVEPFLADQIEVLKGPATLLFGSGAIGGAVNVVDGRLADALPAEPLSGRVELRGNSVNDERSGMFRVDSVHGNWVLHADGVARNTHDYDIPGVAQLEHHEEEEHDHEEEEQVNGVLPNSSIKTRAGALGATWLGEGGYFGLAVSTYRTNYGIPDGAHVHAEGEHDHDHEDEHGHDEEEGEEGSVRIDLTQNRVEMKAGVLDPADFLSSIDLRAAYTDYEHVELEGGEVGTHFRNKGHELRLEAVQNEWNGWHGAFGLQATRSDFNAQGEEAFVPATITNSLGLFVLQHRQFSDFKLELGGRFDHVELKPSGIDKRSFDASSLSAAGIWQLSDGLDLRFGLDRSERAPTNEELFAFGTHVATRSVEIGDSGLDTEKALRGEIGVHWHSDAFEVKAAVYQTRFEDFIYLADTGLESDELAVRLWNQADARFRGAEAEATWHMAENDSGLWDLRVFGDVVRAELDGSGTRTVHFDVPHGDHAHHEEADIAQGGWLPRIAPARIGAELNWSRDGWRASLGAVRHARQTRVAQNEEASPAYTLVNAHAAYRWDGSRTSWEVFADANNLTDKEARPHTSLLRDYAPLPGRAVAFGVRAFF